MRLGPGALPARDVLWMATRGGARTLGLDSEIGSLEPGKQADLIVVGRGAPHAGPMSNPYSTLVYAARSSDVRTTLVDGGCWWTKDASRGWIRRKPSPAAANRYGN